MRGPRIRGIPGRPGDARPAAGSAAWGGASSAGQLVPPARARAVQRACVDSDEEPSTRQWMRTAPAGTEVCTSDAVLMARGMQASAANNENTEAAGGELHRMEQPLPVPRHGRSWREGWGGSPCLRFCAVGSGLYGLWLLLCRFDYASLWLVQTPGETHWETVTHMIVILAAIHWRFQTPDRHFKLYPC